MKETAQKRKEKLYPRILNKDKERFNLLQFPFLEFGGFFLIHRNPNFS